MGIVSSAPFIFPFGFMVAVISLCLTIRALLQLPVSKEREALFAWKIIQLEQQNAYLPLNSSTRELGYEVRKIYEIDRAGTIFPLPQAVRLIDTHRRQRERLHKVAARLIELQLLIETLEAKLKKLRELGEEHSQGAHKLQRLTEDFEVLLRDQMQIRSSCTRLEAIVLSAQEAAQARQLRQKLRRDLDILGEPCDLSAEATKPAFEAESLEAIERQIGREIETYLQLERETEEHLR